MARASRDVVPTGWSYGSSVRGDGRDLWIDVVNGPVTTDEQCKSRWVHSAQRLSPLLPPIDLCHFIRKLILTYYEAASLFTVGGETPR